MAAKHCFVAHKRLLAFQLSCTDALGQVLQWLQTTHPNYLFCLCIAAFTHIHTTQSNYFAELMGLWHGYTQQTAPITFY